uniref:4Fe-4S ferredoxin-type domain-containing protein n=1 Tax=Staphylothermus marinus TaxID=2280 RepID=A0A7C4HA80_STAMA
MKNILWCITGAGAYLRNIVETIYSIKNSCGFKITICFSKWGFEVTRIYGLHSILSKIASGDYFEEWFVEEKGFYRIGRVFMKKYDLVIIAPASSNTIAKIVHGIADTLPTLVFSQAVKSNTPVVLFPSDTPGINGFICSETPCYVDKNICKCLYENKACVLEESCPVGAIIVYSKTVSIDLEKCIGCGICVDKCVYNAVKCWSRICIKPSFIDLKNIERLNDFKNVHVVRNINELVEKITDLTGVCNG